MNPTRIIDVRQPIQPTSILYVGEPASIAYERRQLLRARQLRTSAHLMLAGGMVESYHATMRMAMTIVRNIRTRSEGAKAQGAACNESIPRHRRIASLGWTGPIW
jgi:hypothetical protein